MRTSVISIWIKIRILKYRFLNNYVYSIKNILRYNENFSDFKLIKYILLVVDLRKEAGINLIKVNLIDF